MSEVLEALILGIVQGLTEFLPVSSSGHLEIAKFLLGDESMGEQSLLMTVVLHFATALATLWVLRAEVRDLLLGLFRKADSSWPYVLLIVVSMIPAALVGVFFDELIESMFSQQLLLVGLALLVTAVLLVIADRVVETDREVDLKSAVLIGLAQAVAIIPGISRSGATIATAVMLKVDRERAARFSFLMVVPLIFGKMAKDLLDGSVTAADVSGALGVGFLAAFVTGILACTWMIRLVKQSKLRYFGWYCVVVGVLAIVFTFATQ